MGRISYVDIPAYWGDAHRISDARQKSVEALVDAFEHWRATPNTFEEQISLEMEEEARQYLRADIDYSVRIGTGDYEALFYSPLIANYVERLLQYLRPDQIKDGFKILGRFFRSEYYNQIPYLWIKSRIYAGVKDEVQRGAYTNRDKAIDKLRGLYDDIKHAATYAPYCDAIFMEKKMTAYLSDPRINLETRYGVKLFSVDTIDDFVSWIDELIEGMTDTHREGLSVIFPGTKHDDARALSRALLGKT